MGTGSLYGREPGSQGQSLFESALIGGRAPGAHGADVGEVPLARLPGVVDDHLHLAIVLDDRSRAVIVVDGQVVSGAVPPRSPDDAPAGAVERVADVCERLDRGDLVRVVVEAGRAEQQSDGVMDGCAPGEAEERLVAPRPDRPD